MQRLAVSSTTLILSLTALGLSAPRFELPQQAALACKTMNTERLPLDSRASPLDSVTFRVQGQAVKICYGRPSARGRAIFGGLIPYDQIWRTGANEPTMIHTPIALDVAGIAIDPGTYSLYTVPGSEDWTLIVNAATDQWGHEGQYSEEVRAQEVGRAQVEAESLEEPVEMFTIRAQPTDGGARVLLEWETTRVMVPIRAASRASGP